MKNSKKRIYRPRDYAKAFAICVITGIVCMAITLPVLSGAVDFFGVQRSIDGVKQDAEEIGWTDERTALSKAYEEEREAMAKENAVIDWCYKNSKTTFCAIIRNINIGAFTLVFIFGLGLTCFSAYCIGRDLQYEVNSYVLPLVKRKWRKAKRTVRKLWKKVKSFANVKRPTRAERTRKKVYEQFGLEMTK